MDDLISPDMPYEKSPLPTAAHRQEIARRMKVTREALGLRPVDICRLTGIAANSYSQYESGARRINLEDAIRLVHALNLSLDWLYFGDPKGLSFEVGAKIREYSPQVMSKGTLI